MSNLNLFVLKSCDLIQNDQRRQEYNLSVISQLPLYQQQQFMSNSTKIDSMAFNQNLLSNSRKVQHEKVSCVLLVCVYDTIVFEITNDLVYTRFQEFGSIIRLLIFERKEVTKMFIEYENVEEAVKARQALDGKKLCNNICKMSIYFSTFQNVDLKHQTTEGVDFAYNKSLSQETHSVDTLTNQSPSKNLQDFDEFGAFGIPGIHRLNNLPENQFMLPRSKTDINQIQWHINQMNEMKKEQESSHWSGLLYIDQTIKSDIDSILNCQLDRDQKWSANSQNQGSPKQNHSPSHVSPANNQIQSSSPIPKIKMTGLQENNKAMLAVGFKIVKNQYKFKHQQIYNLFSNFGNISLINVKKNQVRIKFRTLQFAAIAKNYLNNTWLFDNKIDLVSYSTDDCYPKQGEYCQIVSYDESTDRFTPKKSITINPPSKVLHVSGMKKQKCSVYQISNMFRHVLEPVRVKILKQNTQKNMALVQYSTIQESFDVIAECHNMNIGGRKIQISFTKSQI